MSAQPKLELTPDELNEIASEARSCGFASPTAYLRELLKADKAQPRNLPVPDDDEALLDPVEGFRRGWEDIQAGRVLSHEEFLKAVGYEGEDCCEQGVLSGSVGTREVIER